MSNDKQKKPIPIMTKGSKVVRLSEPVTVHVGRESETIRPESSVATESNIVKSITSSAVVSAQSESSAEQLSGDLSSRHIVHRQAKMPEDIAVGVDVRIPITGDEDNKGTKRKIPPLTMEEFISQAYIRKGQRVGVSSKQERSLSAHYQLGQDALERLLMMAKQDLLLQVPRQLLLAARAIESHPLPKKVLVDFVRLAMRQHPIFSDGITRSVLEDGNISSSLYSLYQAIQSYSPSFRGADEHPEGADLEQLRINALHLLTVWLFHVRHVPIEELVSLLFQTIWKPAAQELETESQKIRALTEIAGPGAIGWIAERYIRNVVDSQNAEQRAHREAASLRTEAISLREALGVESAKATQLQEQLDVLRCATAEAVGALQQRNQETQTHLSNDIEVMQGRLIEGLRLSIDRLQTGLSALNRETPRIEVMRERAEMVLESLKAELKELGGEV
jgi:hypothetical protein